MTKGDGEGAEERGGGRGDTGCKVKQSGEAGQEKVNEAG